MRKKFETIFSKRKSVMKVSRLKKEIAFVLALTMLVTFVPVSAMNGQESGTGKKTVEAGNVLEQSETSWEQKISEDVWEKIETVEDVEKIPVWIWFTDIDHQKVEEYVTRKTGLSEETLAVEFEPVSKELKVVLTEESQKESDERQNNNIEKVLADYMDTIENQRIEEVERTNTYIREHRMSLKEAYVEKNSTIIEELDLPVEEIIFQSQLTPSVIVSLTKEQVIEVAKSLDVETVGYYDSNSYETEMLNEDYFGYFDHEQEAMRTDEIREVSGLTGSGVNIVMLDSLVRSDRNHYSKLNASNITVFYDGDFYQTDELSAFPESTSAHGNLSALGLQTYAPDVRIYSVFKDKFEDLETILSSNLDIKQINASANYGVRDYVVDYKTKWLDCIVNNCHITLVASAGNDEGWMPEGWPNVITPANGYNSITISAYNAKKKVIPKEDTMHDFRYGPIEGYDKVNYKPEVVVASQSTSQGAPVLSGIIATMIQLKPSLAAKPELIKAIVMASCHRKVLPFGETPQEYMEDGLTQRQGAGAVDAYRAISIVALGQYGTSEVSSGSQEISLGEIEEGNVNVSIAWFQNPDIIVNNNGTVEDIDDTLIATNIRELKLEVFSGLQSKGISNKTNAGKQLVYFESLGEEYTIKITRTDQNTEAFEYAYAWSTEDMEFDLDVRASVTDLESINGDFTYNGISFLQDQGLYSNRELYVVLKKYNDSGLVYTSPVYTISMNENSFGTFTNMESTVKTFSENEYIEILTYFGSECTEEKMISRQYFRPTMFEFVGW